MRYDLAFFLCCCKSFLGAPHKKGGGGGGSGEQQQQQQHDNEEEEEDFYALLGLERDASPDDIKRAYKKQSLLMHPDKLAQRGMTVTPESQARFTRMKEAYETLSDSHKRETYDAIGERGMKWLEEPFSIDPQELAHNFAKSSVLDRSKIFAIFVAIAVSVLLLPVLVCLHVDGAFGPNASWMATLVPLWIWNSFITFYHCRVIMMGPIPRPDHVPPEEWVDPLPMKRRYMSFGRFLLIFLFEVLAALKLDSSVPFPWFFIFLPLYLWEGTTLYKKWPVARMRIVTVEDLEAALGKPFSQFTPAERELIGRRYSVVPSAESPEMEAATRLKARARHDIVKSAFRILFVSAVVLQLDVGVSWNWWVVFLPFWIMTALICYANYQAFAEVQAVAMEKDPTLFSNLPGMPPSNKADEEMGMGGGAGAGEGGAAAAAATTTTSYGAVASDGTPKPPPQPLTEEEREELKAQVMASSSRLCSKCCSQGFLLFIVFLFVAKLQGAGFSSLWIISPFLLVVRTAEAKTVGAS
jgi:DnaJ domain/Transmembrane Fragile-X-F protein